MREFLDQLKKMGHVTLESKTPCQEEHDANQARKTAIKQTAAQCREGVSSYKPGEPDTKVWRNSSQNHGNLSSTSLYSVC
jgi:hypothetical protein